MGASKLLVRWTVRIRPLLRSSLDDEIAIWFVGGGVARARFISAPVGGEALRFDIADCRKLDVEGTVTCHVTSSVYCGSLLLPANCTLCSLCMSGTRCG